MRVDAAAMILTRMDTGDVASILLAFPKGLGQWEKHPRPTIPELEDKLVGVKPLRWLSTQGAAPALLLNMENDAAIEVAAKGESLARGRIHEMLSECPPRDVAAKLNEMNPTQIRAFVQCCYFTDQVKFIARMQPCAAGSFLVDLYNEDKKNLNRILALEDYDRDVIMTAMAKRARVRGQGAVSEWSTYEFAVRSEEAIRRRH